MKCDLGGRPVGVVTPSLFVAYQAAILNWEVLLAAPTEVSQVQRMDTESAAEVQAQIDLLSVF